MTDADDRTVSQTPLGFTLAATRKLATFYVVALSGGPVTVTGLTAIKC